MPLIIQDTALFYPRRMGLDDRQAFALCKKLIRNSVINGGVLVINWHHRSIAPERLWKDFYLKLINEIDRYPVWYANARNTVKWYKQRRKIKFLETKFDGNCVKIKIRCDTNPSYPPPVIRIYNPAKNTRAESIHFNSQENYYEKPCIGEKEIMLDFPLSPEN